jgi:hypothetical protein
MESHLTHSLCECLKLQFEVPVSLCSYFRTPPGQRILGWDGPEKIPGVKFFLYYYLRYDSLP